MAMIGTWRAGLSMGASPTRLPRLRRGVQKIGAPIPEKKTLRKNPLRTHPPLKTPRPEKSLQKKSTPPLEKALPLEAPPSETIPLGQKNILAPIYYFPLPGIRLCSKDYPFLIMRFAYGIGVQKGLPTHPSA